MKITRWNVLSSGGYLRVLFIVCFSLLVIFTFMAFSMTTASAAETCPNCGGAGEATGAFCDLCASCGSCLGCGYACIDCCDAGRRCGECCCLLCGDFCDTCGGCPECGEGCDPECPDCGDAPVAVRASYYQEILDIEDEPLPLFNIFGAPIFFFAPIGMPSWAILNVLLTIAGFVLSVVTILRAVSQKKTENKNVDNQYSAMLRNVDSFNNDTFFTLLKHKDQYNKRRRLFALVSMYILSIGALILLLIVQNFRGVIALFDWWVIIHAILFIGVIICSKLVFRKDEGSPEGNLSAQSAL
jgi:hypothetical protein